MIEHVMRLLQDERVRIDTTRGRRPITEFMQTVTASDGGTDVKRTLSDMNKPDRSLQSQMPLGETVDVVVSQKKWGLFKTPVGRLHVACVSPTRDLAAGATPHSLSRTEVTKALSSVPPGPPNVPTTVVIVATAGVVLEARELADRSADRTVIFAEPNDAGGWTVSGPAETKALVDLFDPEPDAEKRSRIATEIESPQADLGGSGVAGDRLAARLQLALPFVEAELKAYAGKHPGLIAKRLDGRLVLFREGAAAPGSGGAMPLIDRMKALFNRKGELEKKTAFLAERRTALSQQRDRAYEEMHAVEQKEAALKAQFLSADSEAAKRRVTSQMLQLRKDLGRRQQMVSVYNQQIDVVSTHLHSLQLLQQGKSAQLPETEEITADAARAEEMLAELQATSEAAASATETSAGGLSDEEQALYDELEQATAQPSVANPPITAPTADRTSAPTPSEPGQTAPKRSEPEAG
jgi:hypothetical protein